MRSTVRLGAVDYLNARPLVYGIDSLGAGARGPGPDLSVRFDVPTVCASLLAAGDIDLGLIPTIAYFDHPDARVVPDVAIVSDGPVASVALFARRPLAGLRSIALDTSSRTSVALTRILCARVFEIAPSFVPHPPNLQAMLSSCEAALLIGDPALFADHAALGVDKIDLGEAWTGWTHRPFVWAFWAGRPGAADAAVVRRLQASRDAGVAASDAIADAYCAGDPVRQTVARRYLRENVRYDLSPEALDGLQILYREAAVMGLIDRPDPLRFF